MDDFATPSRHSLLDSWQALPPPICEPSTPVLYHCPRVIAHQRAANRSASATIRTWDWWIFAAAGIAIVLCASHAWSR